MLTKWKTHTTPKYHSLYLVTEGPSSEAAEAQVGALAACLPQLRGWC